MMVVRGVLSAASQRVMLNHNRSDRLFCDNPLSPVHDHPLITKLLQAPKSRVKSTLDSDGYSAVETCSISWETIVTALRSSSPEKAQLVLEWRLEKMLEVNERHHEQYSDLISLCGKIQNVPLAMQVFTSMESQDIKPTSSVFNCLLHACLCSNNATTAFSLFEVMESSESYKPNGETYDSFILGFAELGKADAMQKWFLAKKDAGFSSNLQNVEILISGCVKARDYDGAYRYYKEMTQAGIMPSVTILENVLEGLCNRRSFIQIKEFVKFLLDVGYRINVNITEKLVRLYTECKKEGELEALLVTFVESKQDNEVLSSIHSGIIRFYAGLDRLDDVEYSVGRMLKQRLLFKCDNDVEKVISAYFRLEAYDKLDLFLEHMKGKYPFRRSTYDLLVAGYRRAGLPEKLDSVIEEMESCEVL